MPHSISTNLILYLYFKGLMNMLRFLKKVARTILSSGFCLNTNLLKLLGFAVVLFTFAHPSVSQAWDGSVTGWAADYAAGDGNTRWCPNAVIEAQRKARSACASDRKQILNWDWPQACTWSRFYSQYYIKLSYNCSSKSIE